MEWSQIDFSRSVVHLYRTKNGETRSVPLSPKAIAVLKSLPRNISGSVFGLTKDTLTRTMSRVRKKAEIENLRFHDLRHEATSRFFKNTDLDVMEIRAITGHKAIQMLARYSHLRASKLAHRLAGKKRGK